MKKILYGEHVFLASREIRLAADEVGFSRIAHGQYAIFIAR